MMHRLQHFPISFFAPVFGFAGVSLVLVKLSLILHFSSVFALMFTGATIFLFLLVLGFYLTKSFFFSHEVQKEFVHPVRMNFFPVIAKILLILSIIFLEVSIPVSKYLWIIGVIINVFFSFHILGEWMKREHFQVQHMNPSWFLPVVGNMIIPIAGVVHAPAEISWFFFSVGCVWMFMLSTMIFYRIFFHPAIPEKLMPTLFILFAAPAVGFISYYKLTGNFDAFAHILYYFSSFVVLLLATQWKTFFKIRFYLSWWAYSFPLAAFTVASLLMFSLTKIPFFQWLAFGMSIFLGIIMILLTMKTVQAIHHQHICQPED